MNPLGVTFMITQSAHHTGRAIAVRARTRNATLALLALLGMLMALPAFAANRLTNVSSAALQDGKVQLTLSFSGPAAAPNAFSTDNPPRIALDFADTGNGLAQRQVPVNIGSTSTVSAVEANGRTRVVVDLTTPSAYVTRVEGNDVVVTVDNGMGMASATAATPALATPPAAPASNMATAIAATDPSKGAPMAAGTVLSRVDFSRGKDGSGRLTLEFSGAGASTSMRTQGDNTIVDVDGARVASSQVRSLDVSDYATPVKRLDTRATPGGARIELHTSGVVQTSSYQSGDEYVVEVAPPKREANGLIGAAKPIVYKGNRVTLNFQDIPVRSVLQLLADVSGINIVASDSVQGNVTLRLVNVPWDQALDVVLRAKNLDKRRDGNVIWVAPQQELAAYEQNVADARQKALESAQLVSDYIPISYGKAKDIATLLTSSSLTNSQGGGSGQQQRGFLSSRGSVTYDERTNTLLVNDTPEKVQEIRQLVAVLDKPVQQVLIESRIVIATDNFARELGAKLGLGMFHINPSGQGLITGSNTSQINTTATSITNYRNALAQNAFNNTPVSEGGGLLPGGTPAAPTFPPAITIPNGLNVNLPSTATGTSSFALGILGSDYLVDLELSAAQTEGRSETISSPKVITANQQEALIQQGQEIGYVTFQNSGGGAGAGTATVQFKDAVLELRVTPTITADNRVFMQLKVTKDSINSFVPNPGGGFVPQLDKREIDTSVLVGNGQTVVLGGVYEFTKSTDIVKVPFLGDIPVLGALFRDKKNQNNKAELLIFVTPRILDEGSMME